MESIPALRAFFMPSLPWAWAAVLRPALWASSTPAAISSKLSWACPGSTPGVHIPPVAMSLITSAPAFICSRTAFRTWSRPSAWRPNLPAVAAGHADHLPGAKDPGARRKVRGQGIAQDYVHMVLTAQIADGGHSRGKGEPGVFGHGQGQFGRFGLGYPLGRIGRAVQTQMDMGVNQARHDGLAL